MTNPSKTPAFTLFQHEPGNAKITEKMLALEQSIYETAPTKSIIVSAADAKPTCIVSRTASRTGTQAVINTQAEILAQFIFGADVVVGAGSITSPGCSSGRGQKPEFWNDGGAHPDSEVIGVVSG